MAFPWVKHAGRVVSVGVASLVAAAGMVSPARATGWDVTAGQYNDYGCAGGASCLFYHANGPYFGSNAEFGFDTGAPNLGQWTFFGCSGSGSCPGYGQYVRNNAASLATTICNGATTWYSPNYTGNFNWVEAYSWGNLNSALANNEASVKKGNLC